MNPYEPTIEDWRLLAGETARVYSRNEVETPDAYFHMPSAEFYPSLFAWDSGFHSVAMLQVDPEKSKRELETLFGVVAADGHLPHEVLVKAPETRRQPSRNLMRWFARWQYDPERASRMIDPPVYVYSAELALDKTGDVDWLRRIWPGVKSCIDYLLDQRDLFADGLVSILHPWESGTDLSPQFFEVLNLDPGRRLHSWRATVYPVLLYMFNNRVRWNPEPLKEANRFVVEDLTVNSITIRAIRSAAALAAAAGDERGASRYRSRASLMAEALDRYCFDEETGCYYPRWDVADPRLSKVKTAASILPIFAGGCRRENCERLVREQLLDPGRFWGRYPVPFNPADSPGGRWTDRKLWSGHCVWVNFNWMLSIGLSELGFAEEARRLTAATVRMIRDAGFYEYYDSRDGSGQRVRDFTWAGLALDMMARFFPEATEREAEG
jgi:glycogen debranching enzyme